MFFTFTQVLVMVNTLYFISLQILSTFYTTACGISCYRYANVALGFPKLLYISVFRSYIADLNHKVFIYLFFFTAVR